TLALPQSPQHAVEALGHRADLIVRDHRASRLQVTPSHRRHGFFHALEGSGHAVGGEESKAERGEDAHGHDEEDEGAEGTHDDGGPRAIGVEQGIRPVVSQEAEDGEWIFLLISVIPLTILGLLAYN